MRTIGLWITAFMSVRWFSFVRMNQNAISTGSAAAAQPDAFAHPELSAVPDADLPAVLAAEHRRLTRQQARVWAVMAELAARYRSIPLPGASWTAEQRFDLAADEVRAELRLTRRQALT